MTMRELCREYHAYAMDYYARPDGTTPRQVEKFRAVEKAILELFADVPAQEFGPKKLRALQDHWANNGLARKTVNDYTGMTKLLFRWAVLEEIVTPDVWHGLTAVPGLRRGRTKARETAPVTAVPTTHVAAVLPHMSTAQATICCLMLCTNARLGELVRLRPCDFDKTDPDVWIVRPSEHKNAHRGQSRTLYFNHTAQFLIAPFLDRPADAYLFDPRESFRELKRRGTGRRPWQKENRRKTDRTINECFSSSQLGKALRQAFDRYEAAGGTAPRWKLNQLRHARATALAREHGIEAVRCYFGHSHLQVTEIYVDKDTPTALRIAKAV